MLIIDRDAGQSRSHVIITGIWFTSGCLDAFFMHVSSTNIKTQDILFDIDSLSAGTGLHTWRSTVEVLPL